MADIDDIRKSARKRKPSRKLQGYDMTEKGQTVHMSAAGGVSCNENDDDDDNSWKVKATKRKEKPMEDIITNDEDEEEEDQDDEEEDPKSEVTLDDGPNLDWHILPGKGESSDDNAELYSGMHRATISILAEVHSASVPGYVSPKSTQQNLSNSSDLDSPTTSMISPVTSPNKNGCVVSREDKIIFHKRMYPGAPVRKSTRNQRGTFKKPADPQPQTDSGTSETQLSTCLAAGSSVVDSPVSDASISPACLTPDTSMNNMNVGVEKAKSDNMRDREHEDYTYIKQKTVTATDGEPEDNLVGDLHPRDSVSKSGSEACSELTDVLIDDPLNSGEGCEVNLVEAVSEKHQGACRDTPIDEASSLGMESDNVSKVSKEVETGEITCIENLKESSPSDKLDESDIIESLMNASLPRGTPNQSNETDIRDSEVNSSETSQARKNYESEMFDDNETIAVQQNVAVQQSVGTEMDVEMLEHNASLNTSTEDFVSADEMPMELPHDNAKSQQEGVVDSMPCTPPMSPTMKNNHFEELRRSLTKDCKVMLTNTPTPPRQLANLKSKNNGGDKPTNDSDFDESFHSLDSDEEDQPKTVTRKKSQRRKSVKTLTEIMEEEDDDSDFPVASTKKKGFMSQFQRFLLLTKDLDDTPSDKGTPPAKAENVFQDSPATLLTKQLCSFSLETPVSKQITQDKRTNESSKRSVRKMDKTVKESSSSPLKRKHITSKVKESKQKMPKKKVKAVHNVKKEPLDAHDTVVVRTPERQKITFPPETPLTPLVNLAKKSDKSAMQEFFSPNKLEVKVINTPPKKFCRPLRVSLTSPKSAMQKYFSPDKLQVKVVNTPPKKFCSPVSVSLQSPVQSLMQHLSPHKYKVQIESPSTKVLQAVCNSKNFRVSLSKEEIQQIGQEDRRKSMTSEIENLGSKIEQVTLHSTKKKRRTKKSSVSEDAHQQVVDGVRIGSEITLPVGGDGMKDVELPNFEPLGSDFNPFPSDDEVEETYVRPKRGRKSKVAGRRKSTRLLQRQHNEEAIGHDDAWDRESIISEPPRDRPGGACNFRVSRAVSYAGSNYSSDTESLASHDSCQTGSMFDDFEVPEFTQERSRRKSVRIAKRQSLHLGKFNSFSKGCEKVNAADGSQLNSVGLTESEVRRLTSIPASTRKRTKSRSSKTDDTESVTSVASSTSEVIFCGIFKSPKVPKLQEEERSEEEKRLWEDFDVGFDDDEPVRKPKKPKKREPSRRMSSRLRGGCKSFLELSVRGAMHEVQEHVKSTSERAEAVPSQGSKAVTAKKNRRGKKVSENETEGKCSSVGDAENERIDIVGEQAPTKKSRRNKKGGENLKEGKSDSVTTAAGDSLTSEDPQINKVNTEITDLGKKLTSQEDEVVSSLKNRRNRKGSTSRSTETCDSVAPSMLDDINIDVYDPVEESASVESKMENGSIMEVGTEDGNIDNEQIVPSKKERRQNRKAKSRRRSSQSFQPVQLEDDSDKMAEKEDAHPSILTEISEVPVKETCSDAAADLEDILTDLEVGHSPSAADDTHKKYSKVRKGLMEHEKDIATDEVTAEHVEVPCDLNAPSTEINEDDMSEVGSSPRIEPDETSAPMEKMKKQRKTRRKSSQFLKPVQMDVVEVPTDNIMMHGELNSRSEVAEVDEEVFDDDILCELKVGSSPSKNTDELLLMEGKAKKVKKRRRRSSKSFQPVQLDSKLEDQQTDDALDIQEHDGCNDVTSDRTVMHNGSIMEVDLLEEDFGEVEVHDNQANIPQSNAKKASQRAASGGHALEDVHMEEMDGVGESISNRDDTGVYGSSGTHELIDDLSNDDFASSSTLSNSSVEKVVKRKQTSSRRKSTSKHVSTQDQSESVAELHEDDGRKSRRIASKPKVNYIELTNLDISNIASLDESSNTTDTDSSPKRTQRRKSVTKIQCQTPEEKPKRGKKRKGRVATDEEVEQLYLSRGKTVSDPNGVTNDLLETIFESPVRKFSGTPILVSKRRYHRTQNFPEKPWHPRPGKAKTHGRNKRGGPRKKKASTAVDNEELEAHLDEVLADLAEFSPVAKSPKKVMTPFPRQHNQSRIGDTSQDD